MLTVEIVLRAYAAGIFPMADDRETDDIYWIDPPHRGIFPLERFHIPRSVRKLLRKQPFEVRVDNAFEAVMDGCASAAYGREETWINQPIRQLYCELYEEGFAHSIECWQEDVLVGGLYGVSLGAAFFGESMYSATSGASKVALVHTAARLWHANYRLFDTQFITDHLATFGGIEISRAAYHRHLGHALNKRAQFPATLSNEDLEAFLHFTTHTS